MKIKGQTLSYRSLPHIDEVAPLSQEDEVCLKEIKEVLRKHNRLQRFGVSLLHEHFPVGDGEVLMESCDAKNRILTITPIKMSELTGVSTIETNWRLDTGSALLKCVAVCLAGPKGHLAAHKGS